MLNTTFIRQVGVVRWCTRYPWLLMRRRVFKLDSRLRLPTGSTVFLPIQSASATEVYVTKADIDWGSESLFVKFADTEHDFLDIGAHIGYYSVYLSPRVRRVYAFEPDPRNHAGLEINAAAARNVEVVKMAVSSSSGVASFSIGGGSAVSRIVENSPAPGVIQVDVTTVDAFVASKEGCAVTLVKIDAEGHDMEVLRGMPQLVRDRSPLILAECDLGVELRELCQEWNYRIFGFVRDRQSLRTSFKELTSSGDGEWFKMLFLVPPRLTADFSQQVRQSSSKGNNGATQLP